MLWLINLFQTKYGYTTATLALGSRLLSDAPPRRTDVLSGTNYRNLSLHGSSLCTPLYNLIRIFDTVVRQKQNNEFNNVAIVPHASPILANVPGSIMPTVGNMKLSFSARLN